MVKNGNFISPLTFSGQEWQLHMYTDIEWSRMPILYCYWHVVVKIGNFTLLLTSSCQEWHFCHEIDRKTFILRVNLSMWPLKLIISEKMIPVMRFSTHIYGVSKEIDGKMFIFWVNLGMWPLKLIVLEKWALFWRFQHTFMGFLRR